MSKLTGHFVVSNCTEVRWGGDAAIHGFSREPPEHFERIALADFGVNCGKVDALFEAFGASQEIGVSHIGNIVLFRRDL